VNETTVEDTVEEETVSHDEHHENEKQNVNEVEKEPILDNTRKKEDMGILRRFKAFFESDEATS
jgi:hypothetical protein